MRIYLTLSLNIFVQSLLFAQNSPIVDFNYYPVEGNTFQILFASLEAKRPGGLHADTKWDVQWHYDYNEQPAGCGIKNIQVTLNAKITFPQWTSPLNVSPALQQEWLRYTKALKEHELGHVDYGIKTRNAIEHSLERLQPKPTCKEIDAEANQQAHGVLAKYVAEEKKYEINTDHGATQGARLRPIK